ncbi:MAG: hypothetical protein ABL871_14700 [Terricaulis sp.]
MSEKLNTIAELIAEARMAAMHPRGNRRHLTCSTCGQMFDRTDPVQTAHHLTESHLKWKPEPRE